MTRDSGRHATRHDNEDWHGPKDARAARSASPNPPLLTQEERRQLRLNTTERYSKSLESLSDDTTTDELIALIHAIGDDPCTSINIRTAMVKVLDALQSRISEVERLTDAARNALLLIESSEFADTACIDEMAVAEQLRAALSQHRKV